MNKYICHIALLYLSVFDRPVVAFSFSDYKNTEAYKKRYDEIYATYNFAKTSNQAAIPDAIDTLIRQEEMMKLPMNYEVARKHPNYQSFPHEDPPLCKVTYDAITDDTAFEYIGDDAKPPYSYDTCFVMIPNYHVAPVCAKQEKEAGLPAIYQWKWTLNAALEGKCRLPEYDPLTAASSYLASRKARGEPLRQPTSKSKYPNDEPGTVLNMLWLGLSFMGEPYLTLGCLYRHLLAEESTFRVGTEFGVPYASALDDNGLCTHNSCTTCCDPSVHPPGEMNCTLPTRWCSPEMLVFKSPEESKENITLRICYHYTFNLKKNARTYKGLPCGFDWSDIDLTFALHSDDEFKLYYQALKAPLSSMSYMKTILVHDLALYDKALNHSYVSHKFPARTISDSRGKPKDCKAHDVHYRMPGVPDFKMQSYLAMIATGLDGFDDCKSGERCYNFQKKHGAVQAWVRGK